MPYGRRIGLNTAALAASRSGQAEVRSGEMTSVDVERSAEVEVGRPQTTGPHPDVRRVPRGPVPPPDPRKLPDIPWGPPDVPRGPVPPPDTLDWSAVPALVSVDTV